NTSPRSSGPAPTSCSPTWHARSPSVSERNSELMRADSKRSGAMTSELWSRAQRVIPGGVSSPVRSFSAVGGEPFFVASASGACLTDTDGRQYLDYVQSWGASILGHAHPRVVEAVQRAAADGTSYGAPTPGEVQLAEELAA